MKRTYFIFGFLLISQLLLGQDYYQIGQFVDSEVQRDIDQRPMIDVSDYKLLHVDNNSFVRYLNERLEQQNSAILKTIEVGVPLPNGEFERFQLFESNVFHSGLQAKFPEIRSFVGIGIQNKSDHIRLETSPKGLRAMIWSKEHGVIMIDPYSQNDANNRMVYFKRNAQPAYEFECLVDDSYRIEDLSQTFLSTPTTLGNNELRTYRLALACTVEYAATTGGTTASTLAEMNTAINRINEIYERDFAVSLEIIANNNLIIYTSNPDPYTNNNGFTMLCENGQNIESVIGSANYDIGHVFSTGGGGVAYLQGPCDNSNIPGGCSNSDYKAGGVTGLPSPTGDPFYIDYVSHEIGHQFGGNHTFNGSNGSCGGGNRNNSTAYEPGSGSTIMAYAGICAGQNVQSASDDHFHAESLIEVHSFINGSGNSCPTNSTMTHGPPVISGTAATYSVPVSTPFRLEANATDPDGDILTYCWEQYDNGISTQPPVSGNTIGPNFRSFSPTVDTFRYFPNLAAIIAGTTPTYEVLPSVSRSMNFKVSVRDSHVGLRPINGNRNTAILAGRVTQEDVTLNFDVSAGPFVVTSPNGATAWNGNDMQTITWNVANTDIAPVSCANVDILLSIDGGLTFTETLATNVSNDGSQAITVPNMNVANGVVMVVCSDNVFLNVGGDITITQIIILPVELLEFKAMPINESIELSWITVNEENNLGFYVQRADDINALVFEDLQFIEAIESNSSTRHYQFTDEEVIFNRSYYYRLKQFDMDGSITYSSVVIVRIDKDELVFSIHPNPLHDDLILQLDGIFETDLQLRILDNLGQLVRDEKIGKHQNRTVLNVANLSGGLYHVLILSENESFRLNFVKID